MSEPLPTPPKTAAEALDWLRLIRSPRIGPVTFRRLMAEHGSAAAALVALPQIAKAASTDGYEACSIARAEAEYAAGLKVGARLLALGEAAYPNALCDLHDAPPLLWAFGDVDLAQRSAVAIVGARNASALGLRMARILAKGLAKPNRSWFPASHAGSTPQRTKLQWKPEQLQCWRAAWTCPTRRRMPHLHDKFIATGCCCPNNPWACNRKRAIFLGAIG
jgi:hypothetical protein